MAFLGGPLSVVGIVPSYTSNLGQQTSSSGIVQAQNQVWQGAGKAFVGKPGQPLTGNLTGSPINVAMNSDIAQSISGSNTSLFTSGNNVLASSLTNYLGGNQSFEVNDMIGSTLNSAGPFGSLLSAGGASNLASLATGFAGSAGGVGGNVANALVGAANYIMFPGGGGEGASNFAGIPYSLQDVTFSLQPANRGPQQFGLSSDTSNPTSQTTLPTTQFTSMPPNAGSPTINAAKQVSMGTVNTSTSDLGISGATTGTNFSSLNYGIR